MGKKGSVISSGGSDSISSQSLDVKYPFNVDDINYPDPNAPSALPLSPQTQDPRFVKRYCLWKITLKMFFF